jgi:hypothetical protein
MISEADDYGRLICNAPQLRVLIWGYHPSVTVKQVEGAIQALATAGLVMLYTVAGVRYACFPSWGHHQTPKYPSKPKLPPPPGFPENATKYPPGLGEDYSVGSSSNRVVTGLDRTELNRIGLGSKPQDPSAFKNSRSNDFTNQLNNLLDREPSLTRDDAEKEVLRAIQDRARATR